MRHLRALWRLQRGFWHGLWGLWQLLVLFPRLAVEQREMRVQAWALGLLALWGIRVEVRGQPVVQGPALLVSNHISWLDILVIHAARFCRFVSKADVRRWPVVGPLATGAGTLYIERERRRDALRMVHDMRDALRQGDVLAIFPEGTTSDGRSLKPFHANLLEAALQAPAPVQPLALQFFDARTGQVSLAPCYIDEDTLLGSIWRTLTADPIVARVCFGPAQSPEGQERRAWAQQLHAAVAQLRRTD